MGASNLLETGLLGLLLTNTDLANIGDAPGLQGSATAGVFWVSLAVAPGHTEDGTQETNEAGYTNYERADAPRDETTWTVTGDTAENDAEIAFPQCGGGDEEVVGWGLGSATSGAGNLHIIGTLTSPLAVSNNITPAFGAGALDITLA
jgi:hypothetical protein